MRTMFYVSDRTAITAETIGHSLLAQFEGTTEYREVTIPYVDSLEKAAAAAERINNAARADGERPLVFSTLAEPDSRDLIIRSDALVLDLFHVFLEPLQRTLNANPVVKRARSTASATSPPTSRESPPSTSACSTTTGRGSATTTRPRSS
jgi:regulator of PEP synthase PpsR (kinase-PPPase family)